MLISIKRMEIQKLREGKYMMIDGQPHVIKAKDKSDGGKHGSAKFKMTCIGMFDQVKRVKHYPRGKKVEIPEVFKRTAQISSIEDNFISIMDQETFKQFDVDWPKNSELRARFEELSANPSKMAETCVEYWQLAGKALIMKFLR